MKNKKPLRKKLNKLRQAKFLRWLLKPRVETVIVFFVVLIGVFFLGLFLTGVQVASDKPEPFPISVDSRNRMIVENTEVENYFNVYVAGEEPALGKLSWLGRLSNKLGVDLWPQYLANPLSRKVVILPGERREQVAEHFARILGWDKAEEQKFLDLVASSTPELTEGKYYPDSYLVEKTASPEDMANIINQAFVSEVLDRYPSRLEKKVPLEEALIIASILEREAYDFEDMRLISGVIWNRLFVGMNLQLDATLQYAKGSLPYGPWWPQVVPADKYIDSPYNTYENEGLPPGPIANPSIETILAALNPVATDCLFYFHNRKAEFFCSPTYEGHVELLRQEYGRGR